MGHLRRREATRLALYVLDGNIFQAAREAVEVNTDYCIKDIADKRRDKRLSMKPESKEEASSPFVRKGWSFLDDGVEQAS